MNQAAAAGAIGAGGLLTAAATAAMCTVM
jgi:hypothetical protein